MIGQCLSNKNESATVSKSKNFLDLNKLLVSYKFCKKIQIPCHIESYGTYMEH